MVVPVPRLPKDKAACRMSGIEENLRPRLDSQMLKSRTCSKQKLDRHSSELPTQKLNKKSEK